MRFIQICFGVLIYLLSWPAIAQAFVSQPDLFDVVGVAGNDVLNVRESPVASSAKVGALGPNRTNVEVIGTTPDGKWGLVNSAGRSGWVAMRFMRQNHGWAKTPPTGLACSGTEPFWSVRFNRDGTTVADWSPMGLATSETFYASRWSAPAANGNPGVIGFGLGTDGGQANIDISGVIRPALCSDGMSDMTYGFVAEFILGGSAKTVVSGCCSIITP